MELEHVDSTAITAIGWDGQLQTLFVEFKSGKVYMFQDVPGDVVQDFQDSPSIGRYFSQNIRGKYISSIFESGVTAVPTPSDKPVREIKMKKVDVEGEMRELGFDPEEFFQ